MKLIDLILLIPEEVPFIVELYDKNDAMIFSWYIPDYESRHLVLGEHDKEVISVKPEHDRHLWPFPSFGDGLIIEVRNSSK